MTFDSTMIFVKHIRSISRVASQIHGILRNSWRIFIDDYSLGDAFGVLTCQFWCTVLQCGAWLPIHTLNYYTVLTVHGTSCFSVILHNYRRSVEVLIIIYKWSETRCTLVMALYFCRMCHCRLQAVFWSIIGRYTFAPPRSRTWQYLSRRTFLSPSSLQDLAVPQPQDILMPLLAAGPGSTSAAGHSYAPPRCRTLPHRN